MVSSKIKVLCRSWVWWLVKGLSLEKVGENGVRRMYFLKYSDCMIGVRFFCYCCVCVVDDVGLVVFKDGWGWYFLY